MKEDKEDILSAPSHFLARTRDNLISSDGLDDMDFSTKQSHLVAEMLNKIKILDEDDCIGVIYLWYIEICDCLLLKIEKARMPEISFPTKRNDRLTALACHAAYNSAKLVMDELYIERSYHYCGAKRTIKCFHEAVLACFNLLCKNLLIERSWVATSLKDSIIKAADFATDYLSSQVDHLHFQPNEDHDDFIKWSFRGRLIGKHELNDNFSKLQPSTQAMDDDVVGLSGDLTKIKERLLGYQSKRDIISIIGMGGIGKTTLIRKVYKDPEIVPHFHLCAWVVVSREFCERDVLLGLLESIAPLPDKVYKEDAKKLAEILYRRLKGWRYFIVLDDIWTTEVWDHIKVCFPDDNNGSRIVLTSRITEVASHVNPENPPHFMNFLVLEDSWDLLRKKVYGKNACPRWLINIGMQIAEKCQGLPLAIEVMAGHLSSISKTKEGWEDAAKRMGIPTEETHMESLSNILSISYSDLSHHLKACFLSMINFPKNFEIPVKKLIQLWAAMGFLPQTLPNCVEESSMEEKAMEYLKNLIDRSLIMVRKKKFDGTAKLCGIHDHLWDLSMREFREEGHYIFRYESFCNSDYINVCDNDKKYVIGISQTLLYIDQSFESDYPTNSEGFEQLRVLDILNQAFEYFPIEITSLVNLRYLALATSGNISDSICNLSNLETLVNYHERAGHILPKEIWLLARLRHLHVGTCTYLTEPPSVGFEGSGKSPLLPNLQSLSNLCSSSCTEEVFMNMPNLKQLGMSEPEDDDSEDELLCSALENLVNLHQLENLKLCCNSKFQRPRCIPDWGSFLTNTIKKLTLSRSNLPGSKINALAILPNLEVLKLKNDAFKGQEWELKDEEFLKLKYLLLDSLDMFFWKANSDNFPNLQCLCIRCCYNLCRIPIGFGEIYTLELIDIDFCNRVIYDSAFEIQREQINLGNYKFILQAGRSPPQMQMMGFIVLFIWLAMKLNKFNPQRDYPKKNKGNPSKPGRTLHCFKVHKLKNSQASKRLSKMIQGNPSNPGTGK